VNDNAGTMGGDVRARSKPATTNYHPARYHKKSRTAPELNPVSVRIPRDRDTVEVRLGSKSVHLTNLRKVFWPDGGFTKGDLIKYYNSISPYILPHLKNRPLSLKRNPNGIKDDGFFHKDAGENAPDFVKIYPVESKSSQKTIDYYVCNLLYWFLQNPIVFLKI